MQVFDAPGGPGPYGITVTPGGDVYYASLAGSHVARVAIDTGAATCPPTPHPRARHPPGMGRFAWPSMGQPMDAGQVAV